MSSPTPVTRINERAATVSALIAVALWSTVAVGFKLGLAETTPLGLLLIGSTLSTGFFLIVAGRSLSTLDAAGWRFAAVLGLINPAAYYLVLFEAYDRLPAHIAQPLNYTWAITLALLAIPILKQRLSTRGYIGIALAYVGVALLVGRPGEVGEQALDTIGIWLALGSTLLWASYWLLNTRSTSPALPLMAASFVIGTLALLILAIASDGLPELTVATLGYGAWVGLIEMGVTFLLWQRALRLTASAGRIGQLIFLSPFVSMGLIALTLGETIHWSAPLALLLIVGGLVLTQRP